MSDQNRFDPRDLTVDQIMDAAREIALAVGPQWIEAERARIAAERDGPPDLERHTYLYHRQAHSLVEWILQFERWRAACIATGRFELNEDVLRIFTLGDAIRVTKRQPNFTRVIRRLKNPLQFEAAAFEIETAAAYVSKGWTVTFVEEGEQKTPDLLVETDNGDSFWAECKRRDQVTKRDKRVQEFWRSLERSLVKVMGPGKHNYLIEVHALSDPQQQDSRAIRNLLLNTIRRGQNIGSHHFESGTSTPDASLIPGYHLTAIRLADPDVESEAQGFGYTESGRAARVTLLAETRVESPLRTLWRNPKVFAFSSDVEPDRITGVLDALSDARNQLPREGPGVVWIRIPDGIWGEPIEQYFERIKELLAKELSGTRNQRINAVIVHTRVVQRLTKDERTGLGYLPVTLVVEHPSPRTRFPRIQEKANS